MSGRAWLVTVSVAVLLPAVSLADQAEVDARIAQLQQKLDDLQQQLPAYGGQGRPDPGAMRQRQEVFTQMQEVRAEMTRLMLGPEDGAKYDEYRRKQDELSKQYREVWADRDLGKETRQARLADVRKQQTRLSTDYAEVIKKVQAATYQIQYRQHRTRRLDGLKPLLKVTDEEWKVLEPRLREVLRLQEELRRLSWGTRAAAFRTGASPLWRRGPTPSTPEGALADVLKKEDAATADIRAKIDALRKAREQQAGEVADLETKLKAARDALRALLTTRQEAVLIVEAILD